MKMKETLKFLKFGLIGVASVTAISTLAISCKKSEDNKIDINNQEQVKQTLEAAKKAFEITSKGNHSQVFASDITNNETKLKEYFNVTPGKEFGEDKGFIYKFKSAKPKGASSLDVIYGISYKDAKETTEVTRTLTKFKDKLVHAADTFKLKEKTSGSISNINPNTIKEEAQLETYFNFEGKLNDVTYQFVGANPSPNDKKALEVKYKLIYEGESKDMTITLTGFRDANQIDYDLKNPDDFWKIALDKKHLETIVFYSQEYDHYNSLEEHFVSWKLTEDPTRYEATKTNKYFMMGESKYSIYEIKFANTVDKKPINAQPTGDAWTSGPADFLFTDKGAQRNPYLFAVKEKSAKE